MNDRLEQYFTHYAEEIAQAHDDATCTIVEIKDTDCLYELETAGMTFRGTLYGGETIRDIKWEEI